MDTRKTSFENMIDNEALRHPTNINIKPIDCIHDFDEQMRKVLSICREQISLYPESFRHSGLNFLEKYDVFNENSNKNYICYLLPFWLQPYFNIDCADLIKLSAGSTFLMLYGFIQDDVMDTAPGEYKADILPLGNMFLLDFLKFYRNLFPSDSVFWEHLETYFAQCAESMVWERKYHWNQLKDFTPSDIVLLAKKAAPFKIPCAAACIICDKETDLEPLCSKVDYIFVLLQLLDDWTDWQEDLTAGNCTYFLSAAMKYANAESLSQLTVSMVTDAVFYGNILEKVFSVINDIKPVNEKTEIYLPYLDMFIEILLGNINEILMKIQDEKTARLEGGFEYWLNNNT